MGKPTKFVPVYFAPDMDPSWMVNPGVLVDVQNMVPTTRGTLANYVCTDKERIYANDGYTAGAADYAVSARIMRGLHTSPAPLAHFYIGTTLKLIEADGSGAMTNVTRAAGGDYAAGDWTWASFGADRLACSWTPDADAANEVQMASGSPGSAFANLSGAPKAMLVVTQKNQVLVANVKDGGATARDGWMCSGLGNNTSWTAVNGAANLATGANNGRLLETNGPIQALQVMRDFVVAYKADSMYIGQYVGNPFGWAWRLVSDKVGQYSPNGTGIVNGLHYFLHRSGVYVFDGNQPRNIGTGVVNKFLASRMGSELDWESPIRAAVDSRNSLIYWFFSAQEYRDYATGSSDAYVGLVYNYVSNRFGFVSRIWDDYNNLATAVNPPVPVMATHGEIQRWLNKDNMVDPNWSIWHVGGPYTDIHIRYAKIASSSVDDNTYSRIVTGDIGNDDRNTRLTRVKPALELGDADLQSATCYVDSKASKADYYSGLGTTLTATATSTSAGSAIGERMRAIIGDGTASYYTVASGDYLSFTLLPIAGSLTTPMGVRVIWTDLTALDATATPGALGTAQEVAVSLAAIVGKSLSYLSLAPMFGTAGATGAHQMVVRNLRITDSGGTLRRRLCIGNEQRGTNGLTSATNYTSVLSYPLDSYGTAYTYDTTKRRWDGNKAARWHRARMTFYNQTEIAGVYLEADDAGSE